MNIKKLRRAAAAGLSALTLTAGQAPAQDISKLVPADTLPDTSQARVYDSVQPGMDCEKLTVTPAAPTASAPKRGLKRVAVKSAPVKIAEQRYPSFKDLVRDGIIKLPPKVAVTKKPTPLAVAKKPAPTTVAQALSPKDQFVCRPRGGGGGGGGSLLTFAAPPAEAPAPLAPLEPVETLPGGGASTSPLTPLVPITPVAPLPPVATGPCNSFHDCSLPPPPSPWCPPWTTGPWTPPVVIINPPPLPAVNEVATAAMTLAGLGVVALAARRRRAGPVSFT